MANFGDLTPDNTIAGGTDGTSIGNLGEYLKVTNNPDQIVEVITVLEQEVNEGHLFSHAHVHTLSNAQTYYHLIITPDNATRVHWRHLVTTSGATVISFHEKPTVSANGSATTMYNNNRNLQGTFSSTLTLYHSPTVSADGTSLMSESIGTNGGNKQGGTDSFIKWILEPNTMYLIKYVSAASANTHSEYMYWHEEY